MRKVQLKEISIINPKFSNTDLSLSEIASFVPMSDISETDGIITNETDRPISQVIKGFTPFENNDIL